jgi:hypothetical protein
MYRSHAQAEPIQEMGDPNSYGGNMNFIPEQNKDAIQNVPYFDDVTEKDGWQGQATGKSIDVLKNEITDAIRRLGGVVTGFQQGSFITGKQKRDGFQVEYIVKSPDQSMTRGRIDIAALPVKEDYRLQRTLKTRREQSLKMALYMLRVALNGTWFLQQLSPGYAALMPWMLMDGKRTLTQAWSESEAMNLLLPPGGSEFVEGKFQEIS